MMVGALDIRETTTSAATSYAILTGAEDKKMFTPASVLASTAKIFDGIQRAVVTTRTPDTNAAAKLAAVMKEDVSSLAGKRKALAATAFSQLPALGAPGKVVRRTAIAGLDMEQVTFANGARLLLFPNDAEANRSEEHTSELQSLMRNSYAVFCLKKKKKNTNRHNSAQQVTTNRA